MAEGQGSKISTGGIPEATASREPPAVPPAPPVPPVPERSRLGEASAASVRALHDHFSTVSATFLFPRLAVLALRRSKIAPWSVQGAVLAGLAGGALRLLVPVVVTTVVGPWAGAPLWRWVLLAAVLGVMDFVMEVSHGPSQKAAQRWPALLPFIERESDLRRLADLGQKYYRLRVSAPAAIVIAVTLLVACVLAAPSGVRQLPAGSLALLVLLFYEVGELAFWSLYSWWFWRREAEFEHRLFWVSPVDSMAVQNELRVWATAQSGAGFGVTVYLALCVVLVSLDSPLVIPIAVGLVVVGYLTTLVSMVAVRRGVRTIVRRIRDRNLALLQRRIDAYAPRFADLTPQESEQLQRLITLHDTVRDAPMSPNGTQTLAHLVTALLVPTIAFFLAVLSEVYAERLLDKLLP